MGYTLRYLPIAKQDLADVINFILNEFQNPIAAENTLNKVVIDSVMEIRRIQPSGRDEKKFL